MATAFSGEKFFLAAPYSQWMDEDRVALLPECKRDIEMVRKGLLATGASVFNAHFNEDWGRSWLPADICTPLDHEAVSQSSAVIAFVGDPPSGGVYVELGWASALQKPILAIVTPGAAVSPMLLGMHMVTHVDVLERPEELDDRFLETAFDHLERLLKMPTNVDRPAVLPHFEHTTELLDDMELLA